MSLAPGTRLGPYEILAAIGAGGAGKLWAVEIATKGDQIVPGVPKALFDYRGLPSL